MAMEESKFRLEGLVPGIASVAEAEALVSRYPWFGPVRAVCETLTGRCDPQLSVMAPWRAESSLRRPEIDAAALTHLTSEELIDRFLREEDLRSVGEEGGPEGEVTTAPTLDEEEELVSEELAEIYLAQGLRERAAAIYRKLCLLNPEKSVYFAELIRKIENNIKI